MTKAQEAVRKANEMLAIYLELRDKDEYNSKNDKHKEFVAELRLVLEGSNDLTKLRAAHNESEEQNDLYEKMREAESEWICLRRTAEQAIKEDYFTHNETIKEIPKETKFWAEDCCEQKSHD